MRFLIIFLLLSFNLIAQELPTKVAVIDVDRVFMESAAGKEAFVKIKKVRDKKIEEAKKYEEELSALERQLLEQRFTLSEDKLKAKQKEYEDKQISYKRFKDDTERQIKDMQEEELRKIEDKIFPIINQIGKEKNYALIFNKFNSGLVFAADAVDITDEVLLLFNTQVNIPKK
mgnify:CR=1 FL=1